jgi:hypothetical protein
MDTLSLFSYIGIAKFKSIRRAIRRGHVSTTGAIYPKRPFSNRKPTEGRSVNERKKVIYGKLKNS